MIDPRLKIQDPRIQYPKPPFPKQPQPAPGLAARMEPKPDHGETSYKGSGKLVGRKALVTGADSGIGRAATIAFSREGADVAIVHLPSEAEDAQEVIKLIEAEGRKAVSISGDITEEAFCEEIVQRSVEELNGLDILVNNAAKQVTQASIDEITSEQFDQTLKTNLYAMFWITRAAQKHLAPGAAHHQYGVDSGRRTLRRAARLRGDQGRHCRIYQGAFQTADQERSPGQCGRAWAHLDSAAAERGPDPG
jgi:NAD(P)-dependent dehydrogenase (short-subunit alcohol dehydrogenase family)